MELDRFDWLALRREEAVVHNSLHRPFEHMMGTAEFRAGGRALARMGFSFDAWLFHPQLPELAALARAVPELTMVLNHLGGPLRIGRAAV